MNERIKKLEIEISYLRKEIEELKNRESIEIHTHYHNNYSNMKPIILDNLKNFNEEM